MVPKKKKGLDPIACFDSLLRACVPCVSLFWESCLLATVSCVRACSVSCKAKKLSRLPEVEQVRWHRLAGGRHNEIRIHVTEAGKKIGTARERNRHQCNFFTANCHAQAFQLAFFALEARFLLSKSNHICVPRLPVPY